MGLATGEFVAVKVFVGVLGSTRYVHGVRFRIGSGAVEAKAELAAHCLIERVEGTRGIQNDPVDSLVFPR